MVGADASHAWASVCTGTDWLDLDPTNDQLADASYVELAHGRDYADMPPLKGVIFADSTGSVMDVAVDMIRVDRGEKAACGPSPAPSADTWSSSRTRRACTAARGWGTAVRNGSWSRWTGTSRLVYQLDDLGLPTDGLAFDLLSSAEEPVTTGHADGVVTIDLAEGDDAHREALRVQLAEPYRTMLGHLRHETGHYYWTVLVEPSPARFRELFGDERADYAEALQRHYSSPAPVGWEQEYVSTYATAHPWEDWAESFAHYLHIRDTLQTAAAYGMQVHGRAPLDSTPREDPDGFAEIVETWLPLTYALNAVNRSMGKDDLYPFVLSEAVLAKLAFVHDLVQMSRT